MECTPDHDFATAAKSSTTGVCFKSKAYACCGDAHSTLAEQHLVPVLRTYINQT